MTATRTPRAGGWQNWSRTEQVTPARVECPADVAGVVAAVKRASQEGLAVKAVGSGHSFTGIAVAPGVQLDLRRMDRVRRVDVSTGRVTVEAGLALYRLSPWLWRAGLSLANLGDIDRQTVAGAVATGTHGTGLRFGSLSTTVLDVEIVLADGSLVTCSTTREPDLFRCAQVGLGAFGVVTALTLQCVPAFGVRSVEAPVPLPEVLDGLTEFVQGNDHAEFYWFPHTANVLAKTHERLAPGSDIDPPPAWRGLVTDELLANGLLGLASRAGAAAPRRIPAVNRACERLLGRRQYVDRSYRVFASRRRLRFREMEYAVPRHALPHVLGEIRSWLDRPGHEVGFPLEVRFGASEEPWLSMAYDRDTAWVAAQTYHRQPHDEYFRAVAQVMAEVGGRPHWGKLHYLDADALRRLYPRFDDALAVRDSVDPQRVFANPYLDRVLGP